MTDETEDRELRTIEIGALKVKVDPAMHDRAERLFAEMAPQLEAWGKRLGELIPR